MMLVVKKRNVWILGLLFFFCVGVTGGVCHYLGGEQTFFPSEGRCVMIDAGHGAPDGGAVGNSGVLEKDLNLAVALKLQHFLEQGGVSVVLTRSDDNGIYDTSGSIRSKKNSDLKNREKMMNDFHADAFVSIHMNKFSDSQYSGPQVFFSKNYKKSEALAKRIQESLNESLAPSSPREVKKADAGIYLLKEATLPAVLVECGFLSNHAEEEKLLDDSYQNQIAWSIYCGIVKYFYEI